MKESRLNMSRPFQRLRYGVILLGCLLVTPVAADDVLRVEITSGVDAAEPVAVVPFVWEGAGDPPEDVAGIISANLERSGYFQPLERAAMPEEPGEGDDVDLDRWREVEADNIVIGRIRETDGDRLEIRFQVLDVYTGDQVLGYRVPARADRLRRAAHEISDRIYEELTGDPGAFNTRIAYVQVERRNERKRFHLLVADSDGENPRRIMGSPQPIMSPVWSPDGRRLAYVSFENGHSEIFIQELATGERQSVSSRPGINGAPSFSPDGSRLAMTLTTGAGGPNIHVMDLETGELTQLTENRAIDTEPTWFPDGERLAFTSDRGGAPQVYAVGTEGGSVQRLTWDGGYNARPVIAPNGQRMAVVHRGADGFQIGLQDLERRSFQLLTAGANDESPSFAPNGRMLIHAAREDGRGVLAAASTDGRVRQTLAMRDGEVREPAWSPRLDALD